MKKYKLFIISFIVPILIVLITFFLLNFSVEKFLCFTDLKQQYIGFFSNFQQVLNGKQSILYSFNSGLGSNFLMDYFYYLGSPLNTLLLFFSKANLLNALFVILMIKLGLSSAMMSLYLKKKFNLEDYLILIFSLSYSLMNYFISYYTNIMWLDAIYLMPIIILGIDEFIKNNNKLIYILCSVILIISNYYIAYMCLAFSFIYFVTNILYLEKNRKRKIIDFFKMNLVVFLLCAVILIPVILNIINLSKNRGIDYLELFTLFDRLQMFIKLFHQMLPFSCTGFRFTNMYAPNIYCGIFVLIFAVKFFSSKEVEKTSKKSYFIIISIFMLCFLSNIFNYIFNGFSHPFGYYFRYSFLFCLFIIIMAATYFEKTKNKFDISYKFIIIFNLFLFISEICYALLIEKYYNLFVTLFIIFVVNIYFCLFYLIKKHNKKIYKVLLFFLAVSELFLNCYISFSYLSEYSTNKISYNQNVFYCPNKTMNRIMYNDNSYKNHSLLCSTLGVQYSSSNINHNVKAFYHNIGTFTSGSHYYLTKDSTLFSKKILSVGQEYNGPENIKKIKNTLSIGYMINSDLKVGIIENPFEYQNKLASAMIGEKISILKRIDKKGSKTTNGIDYIIDTDISNKVQYFYAVQDTNKIVFPYKIATVYFNNKKIFIYDGFYNNYGIKKIPYNTKENIKIVHHNIKKDKTAKNHNLSKNFNIDKNWLYYEDDEAVDYAISKLSKNQLNVMRIEKNILEGNINVNDNKILFLSIPYEEGWNIYVDDKKLNYFKVYDAFIGVKLTKGKHKIRMKYYPKGLKEGILISLFTLISITFYIIIKKYKRKIKI